MLNLITLDPQEQTSMKFLSKFILVIQENPFANIAWEMVSILSQPQCFKTTNFNASINECTELSVCYHQLVTRVNTF